MKYDDESRTLRFVSDDELRRFHDDLTDLLRTATVNATKNVEVDVATQRAQAVMKGHATVLRALNAIRRALPREVPGAEREPEGDADKGST
jgi:hypothetical protein